MSTPWSVTFDCADPAALAEFWCLALGYIQSPPPEGFASWPEWLAQHGVPPEEWGDGAYIEDPGGTRPGISFLKVPESKVAKNRIHFDVQAGGGRDVAWEVRWPRVTEAVGRLTAAGATVILEDVDDGVPDHMVMADPEGNEFCVLRLRCIRRHRQMNGILNTASRYSRSQNYLPPTILAAYVHSR